MTTPEATSQEPTQEVSTAILGIPLYGPITFPFFQSVVAMMVYEMRQGKQQRFVGWLPAQGCYIHKNRNQICHNFLEHTEADYLWFVDSDIQFMSDYLQKMMAKAEEIDADILACPYLLLDGSVTFYSKLRDGHYTSFGELEYNKIYDLDAAGTGNMLIHRRVLEKLKDRYNGKHLGRTTDGDFPAAWFAHDRDGDTLLGEDYTFCNRAKREGFSIKGWVECPVEHWKLQPISPPPPPEPHPADIEEENTNDSRIIIP